MWSQTVWKFGKQTILHDEIALKLILFLTEIERTIFEVNVVWYGMYVWGGMKCSWTVL